MKSEKKYFIIKQSVFISSCGCRLIDHRHLVTDEDFIYYGDPTLQERYVICNDWGPGCSAGIYEGFIRTDCSAASSCLEPTRKYKRQLDASRFKYYDDAEEVLLNIQRFIQWLKMVPTMKLKSAVKKKMLLDTEHLTRDCPDFIQTGALTTGSGEKLRSNLSPFKRHLADQKDLIERD
jgi:hypothetical protein